MVFFYSSLNVCILINLNQIRVQGNYMIKKLITALSVI